MPKQESRTGAFPRLSLDRWAFCIPRILASGDTSHAIRTPSTAGQIAARSAGDRHGVIWN